MNNPLTLTDPSGMSWLSSLFHSIGHFIKKWISVIVNVALLIAFPYMSPYLISFISSLAAAAVNGGTVGSFAIGFAAGIIGGKIGGPISGTLTKAIGGQSLAAVVLRGAISGAVAGGISSTIMGGSFLQGFAAGALGGAIGAGLQWGVGKVAALESGHMQQGPDEKETTSEQRAAMMKQAEKDLKAKGLWVEGSDIKATDQYLNRAYDGDTLEPAATTYKDAYVRAQNDYDSILGDTTKLDGAVRSFFIRIYNNAFYKSVSPFGEHLTAFQTLEFTIMHEFGHAYGGPGCFASEACADAYAKKGLGY